MRFAPAILDVAVALVYFCWIVIRWERGLSRSLAPLAATVLAVVCAALLSVLLRERVTEAVYPWLCAQVLDRVDLSSIRVRTLTDISSQLQRLLPASVSRAVGQLGLDVSAFVADALEALPVGSAERVAEEAASALLLPVARALVRTVLPVALYAVLRTVFGAAAALLGFVPRLELVRWADSLGGAALGLLECSAVVWLICLAAERSGFDPLLSVLRASRLLSPFLRGG